VPALGTALALDDAGRTVGAHTRHRYASGRAVRTQEDGTVIGKRQMAVTMGALCVLLAANATLQAQARFDSVAREAVAEVPGLEVVSLRDQALGNCYTLFLFQPRSPAPVAAPVDSAALDAAVAERDRRLDALSADLQRLVETQRVVTTPNPLRYHFDGEKVLADFEYLVREAILARVDARLAEIATAPRLAVAGPVRCLSAPPAAEPFTSAGRP